ncbi:hypothetical protein D3C71_1045620 [compost metagenome]
MPCTVQIDPAGMLSLPATLALLIVPPACTAKASFCGIGVTTKRIAAVAQLVGEAASHTW